MMHIPQPQTNPVPDINIQIENRTIFPTVISTVDLPVDNQKLKNFIDNLRNQDPDGRTYSNKGGWQSKDVDLHSPELSELVTHILAVTDHVAKELSLQNLTLTNMWANVNGPYNYNQLHVHPGAILSGTYYVKKPENSGSIEFMRSDGGEHFTNPKQQSFFTDGWAVFEAVEGTLVIFPGWLKHSVGANLSTEDRISMSFNFS
jgi:uncharacterized protein (TIGR02466 family)